MDQNPIPQAPVVTPAPVARLPARPRPDVKRGMTIVSADREKIGSVGAVGEHDFEAINLEPIYGRDLHTIPFSWVAEVSLQHVFLNAYSGKIVRNWGKAGELPARDLTNLRSNNLVVYGSDGAPVGTVERTFGLREVLLRNQDPQSGGARHLIPFDWIGWIHTHVHLRVPSATVFSEWKPAAPIIQMQP